MAGKLKVEKDELPLKALERCENCKGEECENPACPLRQKREAERVELELLVPVGCNECKGFACTAEEVCGGTVCPMEIGIPCCKTCSKNLKIAS